MPKDSGSEVSIKEAYMLKDYGGLPCIIPFEGKTVMDCGAHIGAFSKRAIEEGAEFCYCYEPIGKSCESIDLNLDPAKHETIQAALSTESGTAEFHYREDKVVSASLIHKGANHHRWGYQTQEVPVLNFYEEMDRIKPQILKMDIEGFEWKLLTEPLPDYVEVFLIEVHQLYSKGAEAGYQLIEDVFPDSDKLFAMEQMAFVSKGKVTELSAVYTR